MIRILFLILALSNVAHAKGERAGDFDYYVMALSWSPNWCALEGDRKESEQCDSNRDFGWTLHGLWPQFESGWPSYCRSNHRAPSRAMTSSMADIMGTSGLAWHQWKKHGTCSGLKAKDYFRLSREAYEHLNRPEVLRNLPRKLKLPASVIEDAFLEANPTLNKRQITITCKLAHIQEARICLTKDLEFRSCGIDTRRDCNLSNATIHPIR